MRRSRKSLGRHPESLQACGYCFSRWATVYDHLVPVSHGGSNRKENLYPSCTRCNSILGNKIFNSIENKRTYVRDTLIARGQWDVPIMYGAFPQSATPSAVLQSKMPVELVAKSKAIPNPEGRFRRKCLTCGKEFRTDHRPRTHCSYACLWVLLKSDIRDVTPWRMRTP